MGVRRSWATNARYSSRRLLDFERLLGGERLHGRPDRTVEDAVKDVERLPLQFNPFRSARSWMQPRRMLYSATTSSMSKASLSRCRPWAGELPSARACGIVSSDPDRNAVASSFSRSGCDR